VVGSAMNPLQKIQNNRLGDVYKKTTSIVSEILGTMLTSIGDLLGVDFANKSQVQAKLQMIQNNLNDPAIQAQIKRVLQEALASLSILFQAMEPYILPFMEKMIDIGSKTAEKVIRSGIQIALNTAEAIPGPNVFIGLARDISSAIDSVLALINAVTQTISTSADTFSGIMENLADLRTKLSS
jgi:hypothetical protein